jgi:hypothetical protein
MSETPESAPATGAAAREALEAVFRSAAEGIGKCRSTKDRCRFCEAAVADAMKAADAYAAATAAAPELIAVPEDGAIALRPAWSATVVIAAGGIIADDMREKTLAAFAEDGLRVVFVENASALAELPPDPVLREYLGSLADSWDELSRDGQLRDGDRALCALHGRQLRAALADHAAADSITEALEG